MKNVLPLPEPLLTPFAHDGAGRDDMAEHYAASADMRGQLIDMAMRLDTKGKNA